MRQIAGTHIDAFARDVDAALGSLTGILPTDLRIEPIHDEPREVHEKVKQFDQNLIEAVAIVVLVALLFMEWRSALLVAISIPLTVAMTLGICQILGIDLQQVSIVAMIIALGLLVDDPVVASDAINRELAAGQPRDVAAWLGPQKLARANLYATVTNCVAFLPLLMVRGRVGDFIYSLPVVVVASLVSSRIVSMTFMPLLGYYMLRGQKGFEARERGFAARFAQRYRRISRWRLNHKAIVLGIFSVLLCVGAAAYCRCSAAQLFPKDLHDVFSVNVYLAQGARSARPAMKCSRWCRPSRSWRRRIRAYTTFVGQGGPRFWLSIIPNSGPTITPRCWCTPSMHARDLEDRRAPLETRAAVGGRRGAGHNRTSSKPVRRSACRCKSASSATTSNPAPHCRRNPTTTPRNPRHRQHSR